MIEIVVNYNCNWSYESRFLVEFFLTVNKIFMSLKIVGKGVGRGGRGLKSADSAGQS